MLILISSIICYWITVQSIYILCRLAPSSSNSVRPSPAGPVVIEHHHSRSSRWNRLAILLLLLTIVAATATTTGDTNPVVGSRYSRYSTIVLMVIRIVVDRCAMDVTRCIRLGRLCPVDDSRNSLINLSIRKLIHRQSIQKGSTLTQKVFFIHCLYLLGPLRAAARAGPEILNFMPPAQGSASSVWLWVRRLHPD